MTDRAFPVPPPDPESGPVPATLVVHEHRDDLRDVLAQSLIDEGFVGVEVLRASRDVLPRLGRSPVAVLVLDFDAPDADALDLCRTVRHHHPRVGLLGLSTRFSTDLVTRGLDAGADQVLGKPPIPDELAAQVRRLMSRARAWDGPRGPLTF